jgi:AcrR family transcriptional regulator
MSTETKRPPTARDRQREQTRRKLYEAAIEVFRAEGVAAAKIDEIAARAGVSRGTFYFHFPTKEDVLWELLQESQAQVVTRIEAIASEAPIDDVLTIVALTIANTWKDDPTLLAEIGMVALRISAQGIEAMGAAHPARVALVPRFQNAAERNEIGQLIPPELLADFFLVNLFGAALTWCGNPMMPLPDLLTNVVQFFLKAARP